MATGRITLEIEATEPGKDVSLADFLSELGALKDALEAVDESASGRRTLEWRVVDLSHSSPARVTLEPDLLSAEAGEVEERSVEVVDQAWRGMEGLFYNQAVDPDATRDFLSAVRRLAEPVKGQRVRATITNNGRMIEVAPETESVVAAALEPRSFALGEAQGSLEVLDIHSDAWVFRIYPPLGRRIICRFPQHLLQVAKDALGRTVRVSGEVAYLSHSHLPDSVHVEEIQVFADEKDLPSLRDIYGMSPGSSDDESAEALVRGLRADW